MSRRRRAEKREVLPDPKFADLTVTKFMNYVMYEGKKAVAENIVYGAFDILEAKRKDQTSIETFHSALDNVAPSVEVRSRRVGGATYQVPVEVRPDRRKALAILEEGASVDLVITDQAMPGMTGIQLVAAVRERQPEMPVVLATGYAELPAGAATDLVKLDKPFFEADLARSIAVALTSR